MLRVMRDGLMVVDSPRLGAMCGVRSRCSGTSPLPTDEGSLPEPCPVGHAQQLQVYHCVLIGCVSPVG